MTEIQDNHEVLMKQIEADLEGTAIRKDLWQSLESASDETLTWILECKIMAEFQKKVLVKYPALLAADYLNRYSFVQKYFALRQGDQFTKRTRAAATSVRGKVQKLIQTK